jgi:enoyl-CoA hydratase
MPYETILYEPANRIARITLNRPEKLNAISWRMQEELHDALNGADRDPSVHVVTIQGAGRSFSAGYDIEPPRAEGQTHAATGHTLERDIWGLEQALGMRMTIWDMHKPVIAGIHGHCLAGGTDLAFLCDIVIAAEDAKIGYPPVRALGSPVNHTWTYLIGPQWTKRLLLTGDTISGREAERIGLVLQAVPSEQLKETVNDLAARMALIDVDLLAAQKRIVNMSLELMGARTMQRMATERDAIARQAPVVNQFYTMVKEKGLKAALEWRDSPFGDGRAATSSPVAQGPSPDRNA